MSGKVMKIFIAPDKALPMKAVPSVTAEAGQGLAGDRYASGKGAWSNSGSKIRQVSLIDLDDIILANLNHGTDFTPAETRRNIVTRDVELNELINQEFEIGLVRLIGRSLCDPCARPANLIKKNQDFAAAFENAGGLRAEVLTSGIIAVGATVLLQ